MRTDALKCPGSQNYPPKLHFYPNFFISSPQVRVNSSRISAGLCWHAAARVSQPKSETKFIKYCYETITNGLKKYCDEPFKDKPSHLLYGATNGPRGRMLRVFLPIIDVLKHTAVWKIQTFKETFNQRILGSIFKICFT